MTRYTIRKLWANWFGIYEQSGELISAQPTRQAADAFVAKLEKQDSGALGKGKDAV